MPRSGRILHRRHDRRRTLRKTRSRRQTRIQLHGGRIPQNPERQFQAVDHGRRRGDPHGQRHELVLAGGRARRNGMGRTPRLRRTRLRDGHRGLFPRGQGRRTLVFPRSGRRRRHPARHAARAPRHLGRTYGGIQQQIRRQRQMERRDGAMLASYGFNYVSYGSNRSNASRTTCAKTCSTPASARWPTPRTSTCCAPSCGT